MNTQASGGTVVLQGDDPTALTRALLAVASGSHRAPALPEGFVDGRPVAVMTRTPAILPALTAVENVAIRLLAAGSSADIAAIEARLGALGLSDTSWHNAVEQLSGGQQQRVALACAMACEPAVLCLDDPVSELDPDATDLVFDALARATAAGAHVVVTTTHTVVPAALLQAGAVVVVV